MLTCKCFLFIEGHVTKNTFRAFLALQRKQASAWMDLGRQQKPIDVSRERPRIFTLTTRPKDRVSKDNHRQRT